VGAIIFDEGKKKKGRLLKIMTKGSAFYGSGQQKKTWPLAEGNPETQICPMSEKEEKNRPPMR